MPARCATLEAKVLAAFRQACDERALEIADRLLSILEFMDREQACRAAPRRRPRESPGEAYCVITNTVNGPVRKH